ncbi:hypothetical protein [Allorhizobium terrae]|nr:hypothetical protein [Allorhizobium terrae]TWD57436.1 hypothetical protein FB480_101171 [Agrobacterium vitis]
MKPLMGTIICLGIALSAGNALAINRYNVTTLNCEEARQILRDQGAAIFRHPSKRVSGMTLYDRYVRNSQSCGYDEYAERAVVPTKDNLRCPVLNCQPLSNLDGNWPNFIPHYSL